MTRLFQSLAIFVGVWVLGSFLGVMLDPSHKNLWTQSLMWAMLSCVILAPVFIFMGTSGEESTNSGGQAQPFDEPGESGDSPPTQSLEAEGWPYTSEQKQSGSNDPGHVTRSS